MLCNVACLSRPRPGIVGGARGPVAGAARLLHRRARDRAGRTPGRAQHHVSSARGVVIEPALGGSDADAIVGHRHHRVDESRLGATETAVKPHDRLRALDLQRPCVACRAENCVGKSSIDNLPQALVSGGHRRARLPSPYRSSNAQPALPRHSRRAGGTLPTAPQAPASVPTATPKKNRRSNCAPIGAPTERKPDPLSPTSISGTNCASHP